MYKRQPFLFLILPLFSTLHTISVSFTVMICSLIRPSSSMMVPFGSTSMGKMCIRDRS